jgi:hypothetical protein
MNGFDGKKSVRDERGRFLPGNPGGPGRPPRSTEVAYLQRLTEALSPEVFSEIVRSIAEKAKGGDLKAAELLCRYILPRIAPKTIAEVQVIGWAVPQSLDRIELELAASLGSRPEQELARALLRDLGQNADREKA